jgi:bacterioferritin
MVLKNELTAINQYFLHSRTLRHWGVTKLGAYEYAESIDEMKHADKLIERILFLDGLPNLQDLDRLLIGESVHEILECDLQLEQKALPTLREAIAHCEIVRDFVTRDLFSEILEAEEDHVDFIEVQLDLITKIGIENYTQLQSGSAE